MKCPRCGKHRLRNKETKPNGFTFAAIRVRYCKGCGWEKAAKAEEPKAPEPAPEPAPARGPEAAVEPLVLPKELVAMAGWMEQVQDDMAKAIGVPKEILEPKEPEPKKGLLSRLFGRRK